MSRKANVDEMIEETDDPVDGNEESINEDFDLSEEYKELPLIPRGNYNGSVSQVVKNLVDNTIDWTIALGENGGYFSDGETPIDGSTIVYRNYLPLKGDDTVRTKSGKMTKRQAKINMLSQFAEELNINMNNREIISESIANHEWIGLAVNVKIILRVWEGRTSNSVDRITAA